MLVYIAEKHKPNAVSVFNTQSHDGHTGGKAEMQRVHQEAVDAIFKHKLKSHHHLQMYTSRKTGKHKWGGLEMWPVHVSACMLPLCCRTTHCCAAVDQGFLPLSICLFNSSGMQHSALMLHGTAQKIHLPVDACAAVQLQ